MMIQSEIMQTSMTTMMVLPIQMMRSLWMLVNLLTRILMVLATTLTSMMMVIASQILWMPFPLDFSESVDTDFDGIGNNADTDDDNDLIPDTGDAYPEIPIGENQDTDADGAPDECVDDCADTGMAADPDDDGDGVDDGDDYAPLDPSDSVCSHWSVRFWSQRALWLMALLILYTIAGEAIDLKGAIVASGTTDEQAQITGIEIPYPVAPPYILQISAVEGTSDLNHREVSR
jgi:hypothetical protein